MSEKENSKKTKMTIIKVMSFLLIITFIAVVSFYKGGGVDEPIERDILYMDLPDNKFFIGTQGHPEFKSRPNQPHPLFNGLIKAALK